MEFDLENKRKRMENKSEILLKAKRKKVGLLKSSIFDLCRWKIENVLKKLWFHAMLFMEIFHVAFEMFWMKSTLNEIDVRLINRFAHFNIGLVDWRRLCFVFFSYLSRFVPSHFPSTSCSGVVFFRLLGGKLMSAKGKSIMENRIKSKDFDLNCTNGF